MLEGHLGVDDKTVSSRDSPAKSPGNIPILPPFGTVTEEKSTCLMAICIYLIKQQLAHGHIAGLLTGPSTVCYMTIYVDVIVYLPFLLTCILAFSRTHTHTHVNDHMH